MMVGVLFQTELCVSSEGERASRKALCFKRSCAFQAKARQSDQRFGSDSAIPVCRTPFSLFRTEKETRERQRECLFLGFLFSFFPFSFPFPPFKPRNMHGSASGRACFLVLVYARQRINLYPTINVAVSLLSFPPLFAHSLFAHSLFAYCPFSTDYRITALRSFALRSFAHRSFRSNHKYQPHPVFQARTA